jgi:homoserine O-succinyltransferase
MSVFLNSDPSNQQSCTKGLCANASAACIEKSSKNLTIGLVNNMPDAALEATERQFLSLLESASDGFSVRLSLYSLPGVPRNEWGARRMSDSYSSVEDLWDKQLDGLIVTGREPLTPNLADEPYWNSFSKVVEWAQNNTYSTVWSCLAAHAAVLHMDGIGRVRNGHKYCGIFDCTQISAHPLIAGAPSRFQLPHSRWNGLPEDELAARGYGVLTRAAEAGVDTFIKQNKSLFLFFQGHPEYEPNALLLEYRRDVGRFLRGETATYPLMPRGYFNADTATALTAIEQKAASSAREELPAELSAVLENAKIENTWQPTAVCIYKNWLQHISAQKKLRLQNSRTAIPAASDVPHPAASFVTGLSQAQPQLLRAIR